jgi:hypothetical protein
VTILVGVTPTEEGGSLTREEARKRVSKAVESGNLADTILESLIALGVQIHLGDSEAPSVSL